MNSDVKLNLSPDQDQANEITLKFTKLNDSSFKDKQLIQSPGEDDFEENMSDELREEKLRHSQHKKRIKKLNDLTSNEDSPLQTKKESRLNVLSCLKEEVALHKDVYEIVSKYFPPNPILPKNMFYDDSPRSGGQFAFLKLMKFHGQDLGKSKLEINYGVSHEEFPDSVTLKALFTPLSDSDDRITAYGEIVFIRSVLDFSVKNQQTGQKKDEVLEENLLDVRRILKNSTAYNNGQTQVSKKGLINLSGVEQFYKKKDANDKTLIFESRFESGNLAAALKVSDMEYHLLLQNDVNTQGHTQWFFFRVSNTQAKQQVRFNILNLSKADSLFNEGMKVLIFSEKKSEMQDIGWHRGCTKISYFINGIRKENKQKSKSFYTLTFSYEFEFDDDIVYFAYCYPYAYSDMLDDLNRIAADPIKSQFCT